MTPQQFKDLRKSLGLTQTGMAMALRSTRRTINRYESGAIPIEKTALRVCEYLKKYGVLEGDER